MEDTATVGTESGPPAPASTASSAIAATGTSERPTTALKAFEQVTSTPAPEADASTDPAAIVQDATGTITEKPKGEPPREKWDTILANARTKAEAEAMTKWREQYGWAETVDRSAYEEAARIGQLYRTDKGAYVKQLLTEAVGDPQLAPIVRSEAARILAAGRQANPDADPEPDVPVYDGEGKLVNGVFSGKQQLQLITALRSEIADLRKQVSPLTQSEEGRQKAAKAESDKRDLDTKVSSIWTEALEVLPYFEEHKEEIGKVFATIPGPPDVALRKAWKQVVGPKLDAKATTKVLETFNNKANAQTVDGSGKAASTPKRPTNPAELAAYMRSISP